MLLASESSEFPNFTSVPLISSFDGVSEVTSASHHAVVANIIPSATAGELDKDNIEHLGECVICFTSQRDHVAVPCGHLYCEGCAQQQCRNGNCYICKSEVIMTVKIYV